MDAVGPTLRLTLVREAIMSATRAEDSVILPPPALSAVTVVRLMSPAGGFTSNVRWRSTAMPSGPVTCTS